MNIGILSANPFSDDYLDLSTIDCDEIDLSSDSDATNGYPTKVVNKKDAVVPILDRLPHLKSWSSHSSLSTPSTTPSPIQEAFSAPIQWNDIDLMYLLSCLHPHHLLTDTLFFDPPLEDLPATASPIRLQLFKTLPVVAPPPEAFSKHAPIGTGRPQSRILVAASNPKCDSASAARRSLVRNLLGKETFAVYMLDKYNVLANLYANPKTTLASLMHGMIEMLGTDEDEWRERYMQLSGGMVDKCCTLEARMEIFLLSMGRTEVEEWIRTVGFAIGMDSGERVGWRDVYADAARFLARAVVEVC